ncbi:MAG TPA: GNAT family N-acetyltransferase [Pyrinomonadaceae bacterium]|nr:GNAT family N-acetyltransferase [Pyrinomonadaceae bacterium]
MKPPFKVEPLSKNHDRQSFDCGEESLDLFLKRFARQNAEKGLGRTFVAVKGDDPKIYGYYTLSSNSFGFEIVPDNLPRYPVPVVHLGRLAVDRSAQGERLGQALLFHAFERSAEIAEQLGIYAVEVYALNENARRFYLSFGLTELKDDKLHLYITIKDIKKVLALVSD